jgi:hypothetical protein
MRCLSPEVDAESRSFCLRVSGAVAPSAPGVKPDLSRDVLFTTELNLDRMTVEDKREPDR